MGRKTSVKKRPARNDWERMFDSIKNALDGIVTRTPDEDDLDFMTITVDGDDHSIDVSAEVNFTFKFDKNDIEGWVEDSEDNAEAAQNIIDEIENILMNNLELITYYDAWVCDAQITSGGWIE